jgi:hypothetical protein
MFSARRRLGMTGPGGAGCIASAERKSKQGTEDENGEFERRSVRACSGSSIRILILCSLFVLIEGQDLGPTVSKLMGDLEYEWTGTIAAADVPLLVAALGGAAGDDVLGAVRGDTLFLLATGHSIHDERPTYFAGRILELPFRN